MHNHQSLSKLQQESLREISNNAGLVQLSEIDGKVLRISHSFFFSFFFSGHVIDVVLVVAGGYAYHSEENNLPDTNEDESYKNIQGKKGVISKEGKYHPKVKKKKKKQRSKVDFQKRSFNSSWKLGW